MKASHAITVLLLFGILPPWAAAQDRGLVPFVFAVGEAAEVPAAPSPASDGETAGGACRPVWTARAGTVFMQRSQAGSVVLLRDQSPTPQTLNAAQFDFGYELGLDMALIGRVGTLPEIEMRLLSIDRWTATASAAMVIAPIEINMFDPVTVNTPGTVTGRYGSDLHSLEVNLRERARDGLTLLAGFRYIEVDELFHADIPSGVTFDTVTRNRLYGAQLGAEGVFWHRGRLTLEGTAKAGLFINAAGTDAHLNTGLVGTDSYGSSNAAALAVEAGLGARYELSPRLSFRAAYNMLWLQGLALATDQVRGAAFITGNDVDANDDVFYHGAFLGLEWRR